MALEIPLDNNLDNLCDSVLPAVAANKESLVDCEHFFDGFKTKLDYALACVRTALDAGANWVVLCDTNGGYYAERNPLSRPACARSRACSTVSASAAATSI